MSSNPADTTAQANANPQAANGRDAQGRFAKGNKGGPGNPFARKVAALRQAFVSFVSEDDLKHIVFVIKMRAEGGDIAAAKLLLQYALGKPAEAVDPDRVDADEWQKLQEQSRPHTEMAAVLDGVPAGLAARLTKISRDCAVAKQIRAPLLAGIRAMDARHEEQQASAQQQAGGRARGGSRGGPANERRGEDASAGGAPAPITNGSNGPGPQAWPRADGGNGDIDAGDWLQQLVRQATAGSPGENGG